MAEMMNMLAGNGVTPVQIDPSIIARAGQGVTPAQNPLDTFGKYATIRNTLDTNEAINAHTAQTKQTTAQSGSAHAAQQIGSFLALPPEMRTQANARQLLDHLVKSNMMPPAVAQAWHSRINETTGRQGLDMLAVQGLVGSLAGPQAIGQIFGQGAMPSNGAALVPGVAHSPMMQATTGAPGFAPSGGNVDLKLSPEGQNATVSLPRPDGTSSLVTGSEVARQANPALLPGGGPAPAAAPGGSPLLGGRPAPWRNPGGAAPQGPAPAPQAEAPTAPNGVLGTARSPEATAAAVGGATASAKAFQDISDTAVTARMRRSIYQNMLAESQLFTTGAGADKIKAMQSIITRVAGPDGAKRLGIDPERLGANDSFDKWAAQLAVSGNPGSDARMGVSQAANPTSHTTNAGYLIRQLTGNEDYHDARAALAARHSDKGNVQSFEQGAAAQLDPRVFQYNRLTPEQKEAYVGSMPAKEDKEKFIKAYRWAEQQRLLGGQ